MRATCRLGFAIATTLLSLAARSQDAARPRQPTFARVLDEAGRPLVGAVVTFAGCLPHVASALGPRDLHRVGVDERGRARAKLEEGLCYVAWAAREADDGCHLTPVLGYFGAGALIELRAEPCPPPPEIVLDGLEAWRDHGPLRAFVITPTPGIEDELAIVDGAVQMPLLPSPSVELRTANGQPLWQSRSLHAETRLEVPPPQAIAVRVVDDNGQPLAGASLWHRVGRRLSFGVDGWTQTAEYIERQLEPVDENGTATVTICSAGDLRRDESPREVLLFAQAPGRPAVASGRYHLSFYVDDRKVAAVPEPPLVFTLSAVEPLVGYAGHVPMGTQAHLTGVCKLFSAANSYYHDARTFVVPVAADGRIEFADVPAELHSCHLTLLTPFGEPAAPLVPAMPGRALPLPASAEEAAAGLPVCRLSLQVFDERGGPARGAMVSLVPAGLDGVLVRDAAVQLPLGSGGDLEVRLLAGRWYVMVATSEGWAATTLPLEVGERRESLTMVPMSFMHLRLLGDDGRPVAGASVRQARASTRSNGDPMQAILQNLQHTRRGDLMRLRTDADGKVAIPFLPIEGHTRRMRLELDDRRTDEVPLEANEAPLDVRLQ